MGCQISRHLDDDTLPENLGTVVPSGNTSTSYLELTTRTPGAPRSTPTAYARGNNARRNPEVTLALTRAVPGSQPEAIQAGGEVPRSDIITSEIQASTSGADAERVEPTTSAIAEELPMYRILVIGKAGVGKTTLINRTFGIEDAGRHTIPTRWMPDINEEITSRNNDRFVFHDAMGFEPGEMGHFDRVMAFIDERRRQPLLKDMVHAIWLCVSTPTYGGRIFETGDEDLLKLDLGGVPIILVFTKYDILVAEVERSLDIDDDDLLLVEAEGRFQEMCGHRLEEIFRMTGRRFPYIKVSARYRDTLEELVRITQKEITDWKPEFGGVKITPSPQETPSRHPSPHPSETPPQTSPLPGTPPQTTLPQETPSPLVLNITEAAKHAWAKAWPVNLNLNVPALVESGAGVYREGTSQISLSPLENHLNQIHASIVEIWGFEDPDTYLTTKGELKPEIFANVKGILQTSTLMAGLMRYTIDLTIIMQNLSSVMPSKGPVTTGLLQKALKSYQSSSPTPSKLVHQEILTYVGATRTPLGADLALDEVVRLVETYWPQPPPLKLSLDVDSSSTVEFIKGGTLYGRGFSDILQGYHNPTGYVLALWCPKKMGTNQPVLQDAAIHFLAEANMWSLFNHANILPYFGVIELSGDQYMAAPWMDLGDLSYFLSLHHQNLETPQEDALISPIFASFDEGRTISEIAAGVAYLHSLNYIHGNINAQNIQLSRDGHALLCDFSLTRISTQITSPMEKDTIGLLRWMAPELIHGSRRSFETDVYAFSMTVVEVLTGSIPYAAMNDATVYVYAITKGGRPPKEPHRMDGHKLAILWEVASQCWTTEPGERLSMGEAHTKLDFASK